MKEKTELAEEKQAYFDYKDAISSEYIEDYIKRSRGKGLRANINCIYAETDPAHRKGTDNKPSMGYVKGSGKYHCLTCNKMANIFDLVKYDYNLQTDTEVFKKLNEIYPAIEMYQNNAERKEITKVKVVDNLEINKKYDFTEIINKANKEVIANDPKVSYLGSIAYKYYSEKRGFAKETIKKYKLGYTTDFNVFLSKYPTLQSKCKSSLYKWIIPLLDENGNCYNFIGEICNRDKIDNYNQKYKKLPSNSGVTSIVFNEFYLKEDKDYTVFVTEGIYDAISIEQLGYKAVALNGVGFSRFLSILKQFKPTIKIILMLDNDGAGITHTQNILNDLQSLNMQNIKYIDAMQCIKDYPTIRECKDPNEMLLKDHTALKKILSDKYKEINKNEDTERIENANTYNLLSYFANIEEQDPVKIIPTGFETLDNYLKGGLRSALYILGAVSSLGKTAFMLQLADQIARKGIPVLFFSLEMDKKELVARSISRNTFIYVNDKKNSKGVPIASSTYDILDNTRYKDYDSDKKSVIKYAISMYEMTAKNMYIISGRYVKGDISKRLDINDIEKIIKDFIKYKEQTPIVFIDYMQIIASTDLHYTDKQNMDNIVDTLKQISVTYDTPVFAISSYNRDNYYEPANLSAFKESGSIEYGADYILTLQYDGLEDIYGDNNTGEKDKKRKAYELVDDIIEKSKSGEYIPVQLKVLKARNSSRFNMKFLLNYTYGFFKEKK